MTQPVGIDSELAARRFAAVTSLDQWLRDRARRAWRLLKPARLQESFMGEVVASLVPDIAVAQTHAARLGAEAMSQAIGDVAGDLTVVPEAFAGYASSGAPLVDELVKPLIGTYIDLAAAVPMDQALSRGMDSMDRILVTLTHDAARGAESVEMTAKRVTYYIRGLEPGACGRCILLSGKHYKVNAGFHRHDNCRCFHIPGAVIYDDANGTATDDTQVPFTNVHPESPRSVFEGMTEAEQNASFGKANAQAIRDGADIGRVVNATGSKAGMSTTITDRYGRRLKVTTIGARKGKTRLVPESIMKIAGDDRDEAVRLLKLNGYLR
jgi:hypothetical protein